MKGAPLMVVAQVLGHADTRMVEKHYGHLAPSYVRDTVRATAMDLGAHETRRRAAAPGREWHDAPRRCPTCAAHHCELTRR